MFAFAPLMWSIVTWIFQFVIIKFLVMGAVFVAVMELTPLLVKYMTGLVSPAGLSAAFAGIPDGVWYFIDFFALDYGLPLMISAYVARFLIRRLPVIG